MAEEDTDQDVEPTNVEGEETAEAAVEENDELANEEEDNKTTDKANGEPASLDLILDIPLTVTVELGRSKMLINDLLQLGQGSVIELTKLVGEPLEVLVNNKLVARGEVVVVNEKFGVRLTDIVTPMERVKSLAT
jgi:flagellar motor switch protein FliN